MLNKGVVVGARLRAWWDRERTVRLVRDKHTAFTVIRVLGLCF